MKRLLIGVMAVTGICSAMLVTMRLGGGLYKPVGAAILEANRCDPEPCWQGIRLGEITPDQAVARLRSSGALIMKTGINPCWYMLSAPLWLSCANNVSSDNSQPIDFIDVKLPPGELTLGDAILQFGEPISLGFCPVINSQLPNLPMHFTGAFMSFQHGVALLAYNPLYQNGSDAMMAPGMIVWKLFYSAPPQAPPSDFVWRGFTGVSARNKWCNQP